MTADISGVTSLQNERGASLIGYALLVSLISVVSFVSIRAVGSGTASGFNSVVTSLNDTTATTEAREEEKELSPKEKWEQAKRQYRDAIAAARAERRAKLQAARAEYRAAITANRSLPWFRRWRANRTARAEYRATVRQVNNEYRASVRAAREARNAARAEYEAATRGD